eukprot:CAMPEP_0113696770 /NCGR_PEP_ID=MMETSP0038_2-20120614/21714_1 /TAXON_ID=2898 /ORGANISM="Cryptomonas paramecium" /LENGTH=235 /DNA_ID=CAMNT_0000619609 /DNA_START=51 /DNA_END=754 /DNA_ORIENTATION=+ /assembly_acc=CAM_ASM_000170
MGMSAMNTGAAIGEMKNGLAIFPRRKMGEPSSEHRDRYKTPVILTKEILSKYFKSPLLVAAKELGISGTAMKNICRKFGIAKWPYRDCRILNRSRISGRFVCSQAGSLSQDTSNQSSPTRECETRSPSINSDSESDATMEPERVELQNIANRKEPAFVAASDAQKDIVEPAIEISPSPECSSDAPDVSDDEHHATAPQNDESEFLSKLAALYGAQEDASALPSLDPFALPSLDLT